MIEEKSQLVTGVEEWSIAEDEHGRRYLLDERGNVRGMPSIKPESGDTFSSAYPPAYRSKPILPQIIHRDDGTKEYHDWPETPTDREGGAQ